MSLSITPAETTLVAVGATVALTATAYDASGGVARAGTVSWSSSAPGVAAVDGNGLVTAVSGGEAIIGAAAGTLKAQARVAVAQAAVGMKLTLPRTGPVRAFGLMGHADASVLDANGHPIPGAVITLSSSDSAVVSISAAGDLTARKNGHATITASSNGLSAQDTLTVDVLGLLRVVVGTVGNARDPNGYGFIIDGKIYDLRGDSTFVLSQEEGVHSTTLNGVAQHCSVRESAPQSVTLVPAETAAVAFNVRCLGRFAYNDGAIHYVDELGADRALTPVYVRLTKFTWSPDGSRLAFVAGPVDSTHIYVVRADGTGLVQVTNLPDGEDSPAWSPTGDRLAFLSPGPPSTSVYVVDADGSNPRQLFPPDSERYWSPQWLPDGAHLVVHYGNGLYSVDVQTGVRQDLPAAAGGGADLAVASDGSLAFDRPIPNGNTVVVLHPGAATVVPVSTGAGGNCLMPVWSPDASALFHTCVIDQNFELFRSNADGSGSVNLSQAAVSDVFPSVSADGRYLLVQSTRSGSFSRAYGLNADGSQPALVVAGDASTPAWRP